MFSHAARSRRAWRLVAVAAVAWLLLVGLPSLGSVRVLLMAPLCLHDTEASGELAYVMADGDAYLERLRAASDLYHMRKIHSIYILGEQASAGYNYTTHRSQTKAELATRYLEFFGVPRDAVHYLTEPNSAWLSSFNESQALSRNLPENVRRVVVVTSAPHTRRSLLCFRRSLPADVSATVYGATPTASSAELFSPIWLEYCKLFIYFFAAH